VSAGHYILWGGPLSLYTGKARSYLVKKGIPFRERFPSDPRFGTHVRTTLGLSVVPVVETPDGVLLQDTTEIIEHFERALPQRPLVPQSPLQRVVAWLLSAFGTEALLVAAMHYRWSYREQQETFLRAEFGRIAYSGPDREAQRQAGRRAMDYFSGFLGPLGVSAGTIPAIEAAYRDLLQALDEHFQQHPYLFGGRPSIADFGLMAPLYAHLARDPVPSNLMKTTAPNVFRWTERMNVADDFDGEFADRADLYLADDAIPQSLFPVLELVFRDWTPELAANAALYNGWVAANPGLPAGHLLSATGGRQVHPTLGPVEFEWRGCTMRRMSAVQSLWHFEKAASLARELTGEARRRCDELVRRTGGESAMAIRPARPIRRENYVLVLG
jgi:glutathione S-transferase